MEEGEKEGREKGGETKSGTSRFVTPSLTIEDPSSLQDRHVDAREKKKHCEKRYAFITRSPFPFLAATRSSRSGFRGIPDASFFINTSYTDQERAPENSHCVFVFRWH